MPDYKLGPVRPASELRQSRELEREGGRERYDDESSQRLKTARRKSRGEVRTDGAVLVYGMEWNATRHAMPHGTVGTQGDGAQGDHCRYEL